MSLLSERAMLASLRIGSWSGQLFDQSVTEEVSENHRAEQGAGRYNKQIVARKFLHPVTSKINAARQAHRVLTLPWSDDGPRALSCQAYQTYTQTMRMCRHDVEAAAGAVAASRPDFIDEGRARLGTMFNSDDYPSSDDIRSKFYVDVEISPMPDAKDFRAQLSDESVKAIVKDIERRADERLEQAMGDIYRRIAEVSGKMADKLKNFQPAQGDEPAKNTFRDTLIYNVKELADLIPVLNITGDTTLDDLRQRLLTDLVSHSPEELKGDEKKRLATAKKAEAIFNKAKKYMG